MNPLCWYVRCGLDGMLEGRAPLLLKAFHCVDEVKLSDRANTSAFSNGRTCSFFLLRFSLAFDGHGFKLRGGGIAGEPLR